MPLEKKIISMLVVISFAVTPLTAQFTHHRAPRDSSVSKNSSMIRSPLSPPSTFQEDLTDGSSREFVHSILHDMKFMTVVFAISIYVLEDKTPMRRLARAMRFKFSDNSDFLTGVGLESVKYEDGVLRIPYQRDGKRYVVTVSSKEESPDQSSEAPEQEGPERFAIRISESPDIQEMLTTHKEPLP